MKVLNLINIVVIIILSSLGMLKANGFYTGFSYGASINNSISFKFNNINKVSNYNFSEFNSINDSYTYLWLGVYEITLNYSLEFNDNYEYKSILNNITFDTKASGILSASAGYNYKKLRIEAEVKSFSLKFTPKQYSYDTLKNVIHNNIYKVYCNADIDCSEIERVWEDNYTNSLFINNVTIDPNSTNNDTVFSTDIDRELFATTNKTLNSKNYLGFINILLEEPIYNGLSLFVGAGFGYGQTYFGKYEGVLSKETSASYPVYQYKIGAAYNIYAGLDVVLSYANINMLNVGKQLKNTPIEITDTKLQTIDVGIRYNFFSRTQSSSVDLFGSSSNSENESSSSLFGDN